MTGELIDLRVSGLVAPVRSEEPSIKPGCSTSTGPVAAMPTDGFDNALVEGAGLAVLPLLVGDCTAKLFGSEQSEYVGVRGRQAARTKTPLHRVRRSARAPEESANARAPTDEGNPVQQLEADFSCPGTYQNPASTGAI